MADKNVISDEDYLDNLLKTITSDGEKESYKDRDESDFAEALENEIGLADNEDAFLSGIENDLFANREVLSGAEKNGSDTTEELQVPEGGTDVIGSSEKQNSKKRAKRRLFGRSKKIVISDNEPDKNAVEKESVKKSADMEDKINSEAVEEEQENGLEEFSLDINNTFEDTYNDGFDMNFADEGSLNASDDKKEESPENQVSDLMDIMGIQGEEKDDEVKKKNKRGKGLFSKKKKNRRSKKEKTGNEVSGTPDFEDYGLMENMVSGDDTAGHAEDIDMFNLDALTNDMEDGKFDFGLDMDFGSSDDVKELDENESLIRQMDRGELDEDEILNDEGDKKEKKKEKKKKAKKLKKPKNKKAKKPKRKKEKEPDEIIELPKVLLVFAFSCIILLVVCLIFGGKLKYYDDKMQNATAYYVNKDYEAAYSEISGLSIKEKDEDFYNQVFTVMMVAHHYTAGKNLIATGDYEEGLHSYLKGIAMYDKYQNRGREINCLDEMTGVLEMIDKELTEVFGLSESKAREITLLDNKEEYAYSVKVLAKEIKDKNSEE